MKRLLTTYYSLLTNQERGIALILTVLILSAVLSLATAIASIFLLQSRLAGGAGDSLQAIMAADSGVEWRLFVERGRGTPPPPTFANGASFTWSITGSTLKVVGSYRNTNRALEVRNFR